MNTRKRRKRRRRRRIWRNEKGERKKVGEDEQQTEYGWTSRILDSAWATSILSSNQAKSRRTLYLLKNVIHMCLLACVCWHVCMCVLACVCVAGPLRMWNTIDQFRLRAWHFQAVYTGTAYVTPYYKRIKWSRDKIITKWNPQRGITLVVTEVKDRWR